MKKILTHIVGKYFAFTRKKNSSDLRSDTILIVSLHRLGDTVFTIPAVRALVNMYGEHAISVLCFQESVAIYKILFPTITYYTVKTSDFCFGTRIASVNAASICKAIKAETIIDITGSITSASLIRSTKAKNRFGMNNPAFEGIYDKYIPVSDEPHLMDRYLKVAALLTENKIESIKTFTVKYEKEKPLYIHPYAGWGAKEWGFEKFIELAKRLSDKNEIVFIIPADRMTKAVLSALQKNGFPYIAPDTIDDLIYHLKNCSAFIGCDSGPLYMANLLGKPTFTLYGPTNPEYSRPFGKYHKVLRNVVTCSPSDTQYCHLDAGRKCNDWKCMKTLSVEAVYEQYNLFYDVLLTMSSNTQAEEDA